MTTFLFHPRYVHTQKNMSDFIAYVLKKRNAQTHLRRNRIEYAEDGMIVATWTMRKLSRTLSIRHEETTESHPELKKIQTLIVSKLWLKYKTPVEVQGSQCSHQNCFSTFIDHFRDEWHTFVHGENKPDTTTHDSHEHVRAILKTMARDADVEAKHQMLLARLDQLEVQLDDSIRGQEMIHGMREDILSALRHSAEQTNTMQNGQRHAAAEFVEALSKTNEKYHATLEHVVTKMSETHQKNIARYEEGNSMDDRMRRVEEQLLRISKELGSLEGHAQHRKDIERIVESLRHSSNNVVHNCSPNITINHRDHRDESEKSIDGDKENSISERGDDVAAVPQPSSPTPTPTRAQPSRITAKERFNMNKFEEMTNFNF